MNSDAQEAALGLLSLSPSNVPPPPPLVPLKRKHPPTHTTNNNGVKRRSTSSNKLVQQQLQPAEGDVSTEAISCICGSTYDDGFSIACDDCSRWCHAACFNIVQGGVPEEWRCWECLERRQQQPPLESQPQPNKKHRRPSAAAIDGSNPSARRKRRTSFILPPPLPPPPAPPAPPPPPAIPEDDPDVVVDIDDPYTHSYVPAPADLVPSQDTLSHLRRHAQNWRGITSITPFPPPPPPISVHTLPSPVPDPRPPAYAVHTTAPVPAAGLIAPFTSTITPSASYLADPLNAYAHLGLPKPFVHLLGPPLDLALDARQAGAEARFVRSGCRPNAVLRPVVCPREEEEETLEFAVFALRDLKADEEVVLGWEWDDGHAVHHLPALIRTPHLFPPAHQSHLRAQMGNILHLLEATFPACACGAHTRDCAIRQMAKFVDGGGETTTEEGLQKSGNGKEKETEMEEVDLGPLVGAHARRGFRTRERVPGAGGMGGVEMWPFHEEEDRGEGPSRIRRGEGERARHVDVEMYDGEETEDEQLELEMWDAAGRGAPLRPPPLHDQHRAQRRQEKIPQRDSTLQLEELRPPDPPEEKEDKMPPKMRKRWIHRAAEALKDQEGEGEGGDGDVDMEGSGCVRAEVGVEMEGGVGRIAPPPPQSESVMEIVEDRYRRVGSASPASTAPRALPPPLLGMEDSTGEVMELEVEEDGQRQAPLSPPQLPAAPPLLRRTLSPIVEHQHRAGRSAGSRSASPPLPTLSLSLAPTPAPGFKVIPPRTLSPTLEHGLEAETPRTLPPPSSLSRLGAPASSEPQPPVHLQPPSHPLTQPQRGLRSLSELYPPPTDSPSASFARLSLMSPLVSQVGGAEYLAAANGNGNADVASPRILQGGLRKAVLEDAVPGKAWAGRWDYGDVEMMNRMCEVGMGREDVGGSTLAVSAEGGDEEESGAAATSDAGPAEPMAPPANSPTAALVAAVALISMQASFPHPGGASAAANEVVSTAEPRPAVASPPAGMQPSDAAALPALTAAQEAPSSPPPPQRSPSPTLTPLSIEVRPPTPPPTSPQRVRTPTPPPPPQKVKMSLRDYKLRKQKRREEEEKERAVMESSGEASPSPVVGNLRLRVEGEGEREKESSEAKVNGVGGGAGGAAPSMSGEAAGRGPSPTVPLGRPASEVQSGAGKLTLTLGSASENGVKGDKDVVMGDVQPPPLSSSVTYTQLSPSKPVELRPRPQSHAPGSSFAFPIPPYQASTLVQSMLKRSQVLPPQPVKPSTSSTSSLSPPPQFTYPVTLQAKMELVDQPLPSTSTSSAIGEPKSSQPSPKVNGGASTHSRPLSERIGHLSSPPPPPQPPGTPTPRQFQSFQEEGEISLGEDTPSPQPAPPRRFPAVAAAPVRYVPSSVSPPTGPRALRSPSTTGQNLRRLSVPATTSSMPAVPAVASAASRAPPTGPRLLRMGGANYQPPRGGSSRGPMAQREGYRERSVTPTMTEEGYERVGDRRVRRMWGPPPPPPRGPSADREKGEGEWEEQRERGGRAGSENGGRDAWGRWR